MAPILHDLFHEINWEQLSVVVAAMVGLVYVARTMRKVVESTLTFLGNHMSGITTALEQVVENLAKMNERVDRLHDDNVEARRRK